MRFVTIPRLAVLVLVLGLICIPLHAQEQQQQQQPQTQQQPTEPSMDQHIAQSFSGKIVKAGSDLALQDKADNATYKLDNADQAKQFVGKDVKVTGSLDPATNTIKVQRIELAVPPGK